MAAVARTTSARERKTPVPGPPPVENVPVEKSPLSTLRAVYRPRHGARRRRDGRPRQGGRGRRQGKVTVTTARRLRVASVAPPSPMRRDRDPAGIDAVPLDEVVLRGLGAGHRERLPVSLLLRVGRGGDRAGGREVVLQPEGDAVEDRLRDVRQAALARVEEDLVGRRGRRPRGRRGFGDGGFAGGGRRRGGGRRGRRGRRRGLGLARCHLDGGPRRPRGRRRPGDLDVAADRTRRGSVVRPLVDVDPDRARGGKAALLREEEAGAQEGLRVGGGSGLAAAEEVAVDLADEAQLLAKDRPGAAEAPDVLARQGRTDRGRGRVGVRGPVVRVVEVLDLDARPVVAEREPEVVVRLSRRERVRVADAAAGRDPDATEERDAHGIARIEDELRAEADLVRLVDREPAVGVAAVDVPRPVAGVGRVMESAAEDGRLPAREDAVGHGDAEPSLAVPEGISGEDRIVDRRSRRQLPAVAVETEREEPGRNGLGGHRLDQSRVARQRGRHLREGRGRHGEEHRRGEEESDPHPSHGISF